jgi:RNA polymerase sigma factor (sigma-70 family)
MNVVNLVHSVVNRFKTNNSQDDLFSEGILGVMKACDTYSSEKNTCFLTYARTCAKNNILDYLRTDNVVPRGSKTMHHSNLSFFPVPHSHSEVQKLALLADVPYDTAQRYAMHSRGSSLEAADDLLTRDSTLEGAIMLERTEQLVASLERVKPREYAMLSQYFIDNDTFKTIGKRFELSSQRVEQIIKQVKSQLGVL